MKCFRQGVGGTGDHGCVEPEEKPSECRYHCALQKIGVEFHSPFRSCAISCYSAKQVRILATPFWSRSFSLTESSGAGDSGVFAIMSFAPARIRHSDPEPRPSPPARC